MDTTTGPWWKRWWKDGLIALLLMPWWAVALYRDWPLWTLAVFVPAALVAVQLIVRRHGGWRLIGPHFYYDLVRLARRGRSTAVRVAYLVTLLLGLWYVYHDTVRGERTDRNDLARLNERYTYAWFALQNFAVLLFAPIYVGSAIAEERERRTLELLHTSELYDREIILGKLAARLLHLVGLLLAGLPVLSLMQFWGGVDMLLILGNWVNTLFLLVSASSVCLLFSTLSRTVTGAVLASYALLMPVGLGCIGVGQWVLFDTRAGATGGLTIQDLIPLLVAHVLVTVICLGVAIASVRDRSDFEPPFRPIAEEAEPAAAPRLGPLAPALLVAQPAARAVDTAPQTTLPDLDDRPLLPPVGDDALRWKEYYVGERSLLFSPIMLLPFLPFIAWGFLAIIVDSFDPDNRLRGNGEVAGWEVGLRFFFYVFLSGYALGVAFRATAAVARERQQQTLDPLLLLPIDRQEILWAKWVGCLYKGWPWLVLVGLNLAVGVALGAYHPVSAVLLMLVPWPMIGFLASLGLLLSVTLKTVLRANLVMVMILLIFVIGAFLDAPSPVYVLEAVTAPLRGPLVSEPMRLLNAVGMLALYLSGAAVCALRARAWFNRDSEHV